MNKEITETGNPELNLSEDEATFMGGEYLHEVNPALESLTSTDRKQLEQALDYLEHHPRLIRNSYGYSFLKTAINNAFKVPSEDFDNADLLARMMRLLGTIQAQKMTKEFNPFAQCLLTLKHERVTVRKESIKTLIKLIRSCGEHKTQLHFDDFYDNKTRLINHLQKIIREDESHIVRAIAVSAYAILPRTSTQRDTFLKLCLKNERHPAVRNALQEGMNSEVVTLDLSSPKFALTS